MKTNTQKWIHGLGAAFVGGGASAIVSGFTSNIVAPHDFNLATLKGALNMLAMMIASFVINGAFSAAFYLKQSPLPDADVSTVEVSRVTHSDGETKVETAKTTVTKEPNEK